MAGNNSGLMNFTKTIILPILIALIIYLIIFHALLPLYRHHRARYAQYLPLNTLPTSLRPSHLHSRFSSSILRIFLPSTWFSLGYSNNSHNNNNSSRLRHPSIPSTISEEDSDNASDRFSDEHGEAMVGFDMSLRAADANRRRRDGMDRQVARGILAAREMNATESDTVANHTVFTEPPPEGRLSRELEEVFRDDSDDDEEGEERGVTVGRRSLSISRP